MAEQEKPRLVIEPDKVRDDEPTHTDAHSPVIKDLEQKLAALEAANRKLRKDNAALWELEKNYKKLDEVNRQEIDKQKSIIARLAQNVEHYKRQASSRTSAFDDLTKEFEVSSEVILFSDVGGLDPVIDKIHHYEDGILEPELFRAYGRDIPRGLLLHGPPGCGKTMIAKAISNELRCAFINLQRTKYTSEFINAPAKKLDAILQQCADYAHKNDRKIVIFIDEAEQVFMKRGSYGYHPMDGQVLGVWLEWMDGMSTSDNLVYIAATNRVDIFDEAAMRRFNYMIEVPKPDRKGVEEVLRKQVDYKHRLAEREIYMIDDYARLAAILHEKDVSGDDIKKVLEATADHQIRELRAAAGADGTDSPKTLPRIYQFQLEEQARNYNPAAQKHASKKIGFGR